MDFAIIEPLVRLAWLAGAVAFVLGLIRMNSPATARNGNLLSAGGMAVAVAATAIYLFVIPHDGGLNVTGWLVIIVGILISIFVIGAGCVTFTVLWFRQNMDITETSDANAAAEFKDDKGESVVVRFEKNTNIEGQIVRIDSGLGL